MIMVDELKRKIEALLFATQGLTVKRISETLNAGSDEVLKALGDLKLDYGTRESAMIISDEGELWKLTVKSQHVNLVKDLIPSEFPKSILETLAVIVSKNPSNRSDIVINQSDIIKLRGNKAYDHIKSLEDQGLIQAKPLGRSRELKLTDKFYDYFDSNPEDVKNKFDKIMPGQS